MSLNNDMRQNIQSNLDFSCSPTGEARKTGGEGSESLRTTSAPESPARTNTTMEEIVERENLKEALRRVKANKGGPGVDGITFGQIDDHLKQHWPAIREQLLNGTYEPKPVKRVEIPKPDGGVRKLGIPTVSANCTRAQFASGMGGDPPSVPSAPRPALPGFESASNRRY